MPRKVSEMINKCRVCGEEYSCYFYAQKSKIRRFMLKEHVCGNCATWMTRKIDPEAKEEIIDGVSYAVYPFQEIAGLGEMLGGKGRSKYIMKLDTLTSYKSNDIWKIGTPPPAFNVQNTAMFVDPKTYLALKEGPFECHGVGCLDRYTCAFYFKDKEEKNGPANNVPENWVDGDEKCINYLNINNLNKFIMEWRKKRL